MDRKRRPLLVIIAAVLAAGAGLLAFDYLAQPRSEAAQIPPRPVVVALVPIGARQQITAAMVHTVLRSADSVDPGSYSSADAVSGNVAFADIPAGAALTSSNSGRAEQLPSLIHLKRGMRAMSIPVDEVKDVSGLIQPGDHVDVYAIPPRMGSETPQAFAILRNVIVLAIGGLIDPPAGATPGPQAALRSVTLRVTTDQAKTLAVADLNATLRLALRPPDEPTGSEAADTFTLPRAAAAPAISVPAAAPVAVPAMPAAQPAAPAAAPQPSSGGGVEYILGDRVQKSSGSP